MAEFETDRISGERICIRSRHWLDAGIAHGFVGGSPTGSDCFADSFTRLKQTHSATIFDARNLDTLRRWQAQANADSPLPEADAFIVRSDYDETVSLQCAIVTADCLPVLIRSKDSLAGVHAGWRGLAADIIRKTLEAMAPDGENQVDVLIGPAAGPERYEVREDVLKALGDAARYTDSGNGSYMLDLAGTAVAQIESCCANARITIVPICTMSDTRFHSYRREGPGRGRNVSFIAVN